LRACRPTVRRPTVRPTGLRFRNLLVVLQSVATVILIFCSLTVYRQLGYIRDKDLRYAKDSVVMVRVSGREASVLKAELSRNPRILDMAISTEPPATILESSFAEWEGKTEDKELLVYRLKIDDRFLGFYKIPILSYILV
jgi:hypothetical protein